MGPTFFLCSYFSLLFFSENALLSILLYVKRVKWEKLSLILGCGYLFRMSVQKTHVVSSGIHGDT